MDVLHQDVAGRVTIERQRTCTHLIEDHSERIKIAAVCASEALRNLWRDVGHIIEWESKRILHTIETKISEFWFSW